MSINKITITEYLDFVKKTDRLPSKDLSAVLHGLFGEVGGIMAATKKIKREPDSFKGFDNVILEEFGDSFWYLCCLATRLEVDIQNVLIKLTQHTNTQPEVIITSGETALSLAYTQNIESSFDDALVNLGKLTGDFLSIEFVSQNSEANISSFLKVFFDLINLIKIDFSQVLGANIEKVSSRFIRPKNSDLPVFDVDYPDFEQLPQKFEIEFVKRTLSSQAIRMNGIFLGSPLTDNIHDQDGYRYHDVFHFTYAAILHWSPTFRALLKHKRKSNSQTDEEQDGGRAIVVEEGLTAWIFTIAKENNFFINMNNLTFDMLKNVGQFVKGYEVEECPLILWEEAILGGYKVFRKVRENGGGVVIGDRNSRTISYQKNI